jgi:hypothetical protein
LENFIVAVGKPELSNKMVSYTTDQDVFVIKTFYSSGFSRVAPSTDNIIESFLFVLRHRQTLLSGLLNSLKGQSCVCDKCSKGRQRDASVHTQEVTGAAPEAMTRRQSVRRLAKQIWISISTAWKICRDYLPLFLCKM